MVVRKFTKWVEGTIGKSRGGDDREVEGREEEGREEEGRDVEIVRK